MSAASVSELTLGLCTATDRGSAALVRGGRILAEHVYDGAVGHAELVLEAVTRVLVEAGVTLDDVTCVGVSVGPGSFTGTRVALSVAKGLWLARRLPVAGVTSLEALAGARDVVAAIDARRGEVFVEVFRGGRGEGAKLLRVEAARELASSSGLPVVGTASAVLGGEDTHPLASAVASLAARREARGDLDDAASLEPVYLRAPDFGR